MTASTHLNSEAYLKYNSSRGRIEKNCLFC